jgi:DNA invertase Pin-like site-specific DNA recombinase
MNQRIGYARVSTDDQNLDLQRDALHLAGVQTIYEETASGKTVGDTLVVWRLDRLGRSLPDLVHIVAELEERGIGFESIAEKIETTSAAGKLVFHVFAPLADRAQPDTGTHSGGLGCRTCARPGLRSQAEAGDTTNSGDQADDV